MLNCKTQRRSTWQNKVMSYFSNNVPFTRFVHKVLAEGATGGVQHSIVLMRWGLNHWKGEISPHQYGINMIDKFAASKQVMIFFQRSIRVFTPTRKKNNVLSVYGYYVRRLVV